jgi:hypothetical protein
MPEESGNTGHKTSFCRRDYLGPALKVGVNVVVVLDVDLDGDRDVDMAGER